MAIKGKIFKIETFGATDGPGVRLVAFLQGCQFRCLYCHNPESWSIQSEEAKLYSVRQIIKLYKRNAPYYVNGGITVSGGEPMLQSAFVLKLAKACKRRHIRLAVDTSACNFIQNKEIYSKVAKYVDLWLVDIKATNSTIHKNITGSEQLTGIEFIKFLEENKKPYWVRYVIVKNLTDSDDQLKTLGNFLSGLKYMKNWELLPYHTLGVDKYKNLNIEYRLKDTKPMTFNEMSEVLAKVKQEIKKVRN